MISKICSPIYNVKSYSNNSTPSFGLAKLNDRARNGADSFGYENNNYLSSDLLKKQGVLSKSALTKELENGANFVDICRTYGCSKIAKVNSDFIKSQILTPKFNASLEHITEEDLAIGLTELYKKNYDNPMLSIKQTSALLTHLKDIMPNGEYAQYRGILDIAAEK